MIDLAPGSLVHRYREVNPHADCVGVIISVDRGEFDVYGDSEIRFQSNPLSTVIGCFVLTPEWISWTATPFWSCVIAQPM